MKFRKRVLFVWLLSLNTILAAAQTTAHLRTANTDLQFEAGPAAPRVVSLQTTGQGAWVNQAPEVLIDSAYIGDKKVPLRWHLDANASKLQPDRVVFVYETRSPHLRLSWEWQARAAFGPIEHQIRIQNLSGGEVWLPLQDSFQFDWQADPSAALEEIYVEKGSSTPSDVGTHQVPIGSGYSWEGTSSTYGHLKPGRPREIIPWFMVQQIADPHSGWYVGVEFSGRTRLTLNRDGASLKGAVGLNPDLGPFRTRVESGQSFDVPTIFLGATSGGADATGNVLRRWVRHVLGNPITWKDPKYPLMVNNSWGGGMNVNEAIAEGMIRDAQSLGLDMFHMDAGWFRGVGDWYPNRKKFPHGLAAIADYAHAHGLRFGLWVDWTQAGLDTQPGALNARDPKVRDWMVTDLPKDWKPEPFKGQTIDLGVPAAKQWAQREVQRIVTDYHLDMLEHDGYLVAQGCSRTDHPHAPPDPLNECVYKDWGSYWVDSSNSTDVSYHAVRAYYDIYSKLREDHPGLLFEICDDGGRMVDFGSAAHGDYFSITDTYDPLSNRRAFYDASHVLPSAMLESYVEKWPTPHIENFVYMLRSGMMGWVTIMMDTTTWTKEQHEVAREEFALYKNQLRPLIRDADLYHVSPRPDGVHWDGMEYFDPQRARGVVYAFRGSTETESNHAYMLKGLLPDAMYKLHYHDGSSPDGTVSGHDLMTAGLPVHLGMPDTSELIFLEETKRN